MLTPKQNIGRITGPINGKHCLLGLSNQIKSQSAADERITVELLRVTEPEVS